MEPKEVIIQHLKEWTKEFDGIHIKYTYDKSTDYHIVEVSPEEIRRGNKKYMEYELNLYMYAMNNGFDLLIAGDAIGLNGDDLLYKI